MCGIAGFVDDTTSPELRNEAVGRMCAAMLHRGPDDSGIESAGHGTLGMRRLAIFDPAHGHQPMRTSDGRFSLVFNGAIYNFHALRSELKSHGWMFRTDCDTEVLLAGYARWGEGVLPRLRGMFAFAAWDSFEQTLFLARDPFGIKPLYFRQDAGRLLFASEIKALIASGVADFEIDPNSVADYLAWFAVPSPRTIYRNVFSLRPGECALFQKGILSIRSAWDFRSIPSASRNSRTKEEFSHELRVRLDDTIRAHMLADVPVGAFLSGGLDSAVVTGLMSRAGGALKTFSIGFEEEGYSEAADAEATAKHFGTLHTLRVLTGGEVATDLEQLLRAFDQPSGDGINTYYVSQAAKAGGVKVALSGLGGDELFGGYPSFQNLPVLARWLPFWLRVPSGVRAMILARMRRGDTRTRKLADCLQYARNTHELASLQRRVFSEDGRRQLLNPDFAWERTSPLHPQLEDLESDFQGHHLFSIASGWELRTYMTDVLLRDSDVMSMRHSLELRVPFVDRPLIEWLWTQPAAFKRGSSPKAALAEAVQDILPAGLLTRRKRGFTLPFPLWMRKQLRPFLEDVFSVPSISKSGLFSSGRVASLWTGFINGDDSREWSRVWSLAVLIEFINRQNRSRA